MREIKFRAKDFQGNWVYGDLHTLCDVPHIHTEVTSYPFAGRRAFVEKDTIGQFTGLHDADGKPIYEGDIIESSMVGHVVRHLVRYTPERAAFTVILSRYIGDVDFERTEVSGIEQKWIDECQKKVVGNYWDNPELLK